MMAASIQVEVVSAESKLFEGEAKMVTVTALRGDMGIYPNHAPTLAQLVPGHVIIDQLDGSKEHIFVSGGYVEVQPKMVIVLSDTALRAHDLDEARVLEAKRKAEHAIEAAHADFDYGAARAQLASAIAQLRLIKQIRRT